MKSLIISIVVILFISPLVCASQPKSPIETIDAWHNTAIRLKNEGKYSEAEALFKKILTAEPTNANALFDLGNLYLIEKKYENALNCYKKSKTVTAYDKEMDNYYYTVSLCYIGLGNNKEAVTNLKDCLKINPNYKGAKELLGMVEDAYKTNAKLNIEKFNQK